MHLFLEGPVRTGKSTLIRQCIAPYLHQIRGFSCQRLWLGDTPSGYRLAPASETALDAPLLPNTPDIFLSYESKPPKKDPSVFEGLGTMLLEQAKGAPLILLDEIGGSELLVPAFRKKLYEVLSGPSPCIGVLKLASKAGSMSKAAGYPGTVVEYNLQLRQDLEEAFNGEICYFEPEHRGEVKARIESFLKSVFSGRQTV